MHLVGITARHPRLKVRGKTFVILPKQQLGVVLRVGSSALALPVLPPTPAGTSAEVPSKGQKMPRGHFYLLH